MISNRHIIELYINDELVDLKSTDSLNLRINNVLFDPKKAVTKQAEYSYSFELPSTPKNDRIFNYANTLSRINKFHQRYPAKVYADGTLLFDGSLTLSKYDASKGMYSCNLVNIKINSLEDIFGDAVMTDVNTWNVPFNGVSSISLANNEIEGKYFFPFACYGAFIKDPFSSDDAGNEYTSKHQIDGWNKWYYSSFYPSLNVMETIRKCFEWKGYKCQGTAFSDPKINDIFASCNLAKEQIPMYNLGAPRFGTVNLTAQLNTKNATNDGNYQELKFPYYKVRGGGGASSISEGGYVNNIDYGSYNFSAIRFFNMMNKYDGGSATLKQDTYMYDPKQMAIVIPRSGWYKIELKCNYAQLQDNMTSMTVEQIVNTDGIRDAEYKKTITMGKRFTDSAPFEIQLIRNYEDNIELIKGRKNIEYVTGDPTQTTYSYRGHTYQNKFEWYTEYPHQLCTKAWTFPTENDGLINTAIAVIADSGYISTGDGGGNYSNDGGSGGGATSTEGGHNYGGRRGASTSNSSTASDSNGIRVQYNNPGYVTEFQGLMPYDPVVSTAFICGMSTFDNGICSVMKNGRSWTPMSATRNYSFYSLRGMLFMNRDGSTEQTAYGKNVYDYASSYVFSNDYSMNGDLQCCVWLEQNDVLELMGVIRDYDGKKYDINASVDLYIEAISERTYSKVKGDPKWNWNSPNEYPWNLNLFEFTNKETKVSDWIDSIAKAFNLDIITLDNVAEINTNQGIGKNITNVVDIDDRVSNNEAQTEMISYPKEMSVKYKIEKDEYGFELTVPEEYINDEDWYNYGDSGFTVISLSDDTYETTTQNIQTNFSYTYYDDFTIRSGDLDNGFTFKTYRIPIIEKSEFMIDGYNDEEAMKSDGFSLTQRFWYRDPNEGEKAELKTIQDEILVMSVPKNTWNDFFNLSYKTSETSIATEYFNISPLLSSNYVNIDVYLNPQEYYDLKNGAMVKFDDDLYYISDIQAYDPSNKNRTTLKIIKKT